MKPKNHLLVLSRFTSKLSHYNTQITILAPPPKTSYGVIIKKYSPTFETNYLCSKPSKRNGLLERCPVGLQGNTIRYYSTICLAA